MGALAEGRVRDYGNWRKPMSAGLGQLGMLGTALLLVGLVVVITVAFFVGVVAALVVGATLGIALLFLSVRDRHGRTGLQRVASRAGWWLSRSRGSHLYRAGPLGRVPRGTCQLPGLAAASTLSEARDSYGRPFALLHVPATAHYTVVLEAEPDGASLVDQGQTDVWVARWGEFLATLGTEPGLEAASVTIETAPDTGSRLEQEIRSQIDPDAPALAQAVLREVMETYPVGSATVKAWIALTFSAVGARGRRRDASEMGHLLASRLPGLTSKLQATGAGAARPVTAQGLSEAVRTAYDPAAARLFDAARAEGRTPALDWNDVGPVGAQADWNHYRHEGAWSVTWSMTVAPRGSVYSSVLAELLAPHPGIDRKRVTLVYRPMDPGRAARTVETDKRNADFRVSGRERPSARALADQAAARSAADEEAKGAGLVNFGMIVTATVADPERLPDVEAAIDNLSAAARILLRRVSGSQDSAFAAALPLGLVIPRHLKVPEEVRSSL